MSDAETPADGKALVTLILDAGSRAPQLALRDGHGHWHFRSPGPESGVEGIFPELTSLFEDTGLRPPEDLDRVLFCGGPGSLLGLRTVAMVLAVWKQLRSQPLPLLRYHALDLAHACLHLKYGEKLPKDFHILSGWKRNCWQILSVVDSVATAPVIYETQKLSNVAEPCFVLEQRKLWEPIPVVAESVEYSLRPFTLPDGFPAKQLEPRVDPDLLTPGSSNYSKWKSPRHLSS